MLSAYGPFTASRVATAGERYLKAGWTPPICWPWQQAQMLYCLLRSSHSVDRHGKMPTLPQASLIVAGFLQPWSTWLRACSKLIQSSCRTTSWLSCKSGKGYSLGSRTRQVRAQFWRCRTNPPPAQPPRVLSGKRVEDAARPESNRRRRTTRFS